MDKPPHQDKVSSIEGVLVVWVEAFLVLVCNKTNYGPAFFALKVIQTKLGVSLKIMFDFVKLLSNFKLRDSPLINHSVFCHPSQP